MVWHYLIGWLYLWRATLSENIKLRILHFKTENVLLSLFLIGCLYWLTGAVASALVKQKLAQVIRKKQKAVLERTSSNPLSSPSVAYRLETALITAHSCSSAHVHRLMRFSSDFKIKVFCVSSGSWFQIPALQYSRSCPPQIQLSAKGLTNHPWDEQVCHRHTCM